MPRYDQYTLPFYARVTCCVLLFLVVSFCPGQSTVPSRDAATKLSALPPDDASIVGTWNCKGSFRGGGPHESIYTAAPILNRTWLELTEHDTVPATGYDAKYLIGYDADHKRMVEFDANTFAAATYTSAAGWLHGSLTMTSGLQRKPQRHTLSTAFVTAFRPLLR